MQTMNARRLQFTIGLVLAAAILSAVSCTIFRGDSDEPVSPDNNGGSQQTDDPQANGDTQVVLAPIESVEVVIAESFPPQYFLHVVSGLPSGCARFNDYTVERAGDVITVTITNLMPADDDVVCTAIYGFKEHNIAIGSDFTSGATYTLLVNGASSEFVAQ
jgi:hypothetical protein